MRRAANRKPDPPAVAEAKRAGALKGGHAPKPGKPTHAELEALDAIKRWVRSAVLPVGIQRVADIVLKYKPRSGNGAKGEFLAFQWAIEFLADRCGMPRRTEADVTATATAPLVVLRPGFERPGSATGQTSVPGSAMNLG